MSRVRNRRWFLASTALLGTYIAGCSRVLPPTDDAERTGDTPATETPPADDGRTPSTDTKTSVDQTKTYTNPSLPLSETSFDWTAELQRNATAEEPPSISLTLTNTAPERVGLEFGPLPPFSDPISGSEDSTNRLVLFHPDIGPYTAPDTRIDGCWQLEEDTDVAVNLISNLAWLEAGSSIGATYTLYNAPRNESCFPEGTYSFGYSVGLRVAETVEMILGLDVTAEGGQIASVTATGPEIPEQ